LTTSLPGSFFLYQIIELLLTSKAHDSAHKDGQLNDNVLMIIFSLPYLFDFICGIYAMLMMSKMIKFNKTINALRFNDEVARGLLSNEV
jgi:hypothetical protein